MVVNMEHRLNDQFKMIASPMKLSDTPVEYKHAAPQLGEHTKKVLSQFKTQDELSALKAQGVIDGAVA
jgi:crotonobetainyl-CoA:carnitine CoA-transferase CaiB-like acyl-CoA transferase